MIPKFIAFPVDPENQKLMSSAGCASSQVAAQFPQWANFEISPVEIDGHDNRTFHLGDEMSVRMPSSKWYAKHVITEHEWLPKIAPHLPLPIPVPLGRGNPGLGYQ